MLHVQLYINISNRIKEISICQVSHHLISLSSRQSLPLLVQSASGAATGCRRHRNRVATGDSRHFGRFGAMPICPLGEIQILRCIYREQNGINSVGLFYGCLKTDAASSSLLRQGIPLDPSEISKKYGSHGFATRTFSPSPTERASPLETPASLKNPGALPIILKLADRQKNSIECQFKYFI